jgi:hypothetical protein
MNKELKPEIPNTYDVSTPCHIPKILLYDMEMAGYYSD